MKLELLILFITAVVIGNIYYDGQLFKRFLKWKKYYKMIFYTFMGFSVYILLKKNPAHGSTLLQSANNIIKVMPVDKEARDFFSPLMQFSSLSNSFNAQQSPQFKRMMTSGGNQDNQGNQGNQGKKATKRSVSETKKKYVASNQNWKCAHCKQQLQAWFEVDHKTRLENGGSNHVENLEALCRNCHGKKTAFENF